MDPKEDLRKKARQFRKVLNSTDVSSASTTICNGLRDVVDWRLVKKLHCYQAINNEIIPSEFITWIKGKFDIHVYLQDKSPNFPKDKFDVIIVPGLAFDRKGHRLGYGQGNYDKFLASQPKAVKIGLSYDDMVFNKLPNQEHDEKVNYIISEKELYN
jgi:5-formyltetrahydrofolate cyclo-ligase